MGECERLKGNRVIFDEGPLTVTDIEVINFANVLPVGVTITSIDAAPLSTTTVTLRECDFRVSGSAMQLTNVSFFVLKTISVVLSNGTRITKEVSFNTPAATISLAKAISDIDFPVADQTRAHCQLHNISAIDTLTLPSPTGATTVTDDLVISFLVKIAVDDDFVVMLCPSTAATVTIGTAAG